MKLFGREIHSLPGRLNPGRGRVGETERGWERLWGQGEGVS